MCPKSSLYERFIALLILVGAGLFIVAALRDHLGFLGFAMVGLGFGLSRRAGSTGDKG